MYILYIKILSDVIKWNLKNGYHGYCIIVRTQNHNISIVVIHVLIKFWHCTYHRAESNKVLYFDKLDKLALLKTYLYIFLWRIVTWFILSVFIFIF